MSITVEALAAAISSKRLVRQWIDKRCIPYEPHLVGLTADGRVLVIARGAPSRDNWSEPGAWKTLQLSAISEIDPKERFAGEHAIPAEHLADIQVVLARVE